MYSDSDTIVAPASVLNKKAPLAILRMSGPKSVEWLIHRFTPKKKGKLKPRKMTYGFWNDEVGMVDDVMVAIFPKPHSYTGQDMVEIFCHGNPVFVESIEASLIGLGARRAKPGEFTLRAVLNGKKSLLEAESLNGLFQANTRYQADLIRRQTKGPLVGTIRGFVNTILEIQAHIEATIDYGEEDLDALAKNQIEQKLKDLHTGFEKIRRTANFLKGMQRGFKVLIMGEPNVGKSTLFNTLVHYERAIVTPIPGTTRDFISEQIEVRGLPIILIDSAGIRETQDEIETLGIKKIYELLHEVDLVLYLFTKTEKPKPFPALQDIPEEKWLTLATKGDIEGETPENHLIISSFTKQGIEQLEEEIVLRLATNFDQRTSYLINQRQEEIVKAVLTLLHKAIGDYQEGFGEEVLSSYLNLVRAKLGELTGETTVEDVLDRMFSTFCLGK